MLSIFNFLAFTFPFARPVSEHSAAVVAVAALSFAFPALHSVKDCWTVLV